MKRFYVYWNGSNVLGIYAMNLDDAKFIAAHHLGKHTYFVFPIEDWRVVFSSHKGCPGTRKVGKLDEWCSTISQGNDPEVEKEFEWGQGAIEEGVGVLQEFSQQELLAEVCY